MQDQLFCTATLAGKKNYHLLVATPKKVTCYTTVRPGVRPVGPFAGEK